MDSNRSQLKKWILLITYAIVLFLTLSNLDRVAGVLGYVYRIVSPVITGIFIAYVLNIPMKLIENKLLAKVWDKSPVLYRMKRGLSLVLTLLFVGGLLVGLLWFIIPQVTGSVTKLGASLPGFFDNVTEYVNKLTTEYDFASDIWKKVGENWKEIMSQLTQFLSNVVPYLFNFTIGVTTSVINFVLSLTISIYLLFSKDKLIHILKRINYAFIKTEYADRIMRASSKANKTFSRFIGGQLTEALILGTLCFIGMTIFRMPYAPLVSVIIGVTALIPYLGAYIGTIPSILIILTTGLMPAIGFLVFILLLQQFDGNVIYPRVVGNSIGLGGLWVLLAIMIGGSVFGFMGMLLGVPVFALIYGLCRLIVNNRLKKKGIVIEPLPSLKKPIKSRCKKDRRPPDDPPASTDSFTTEPTADQDTIQK